MSGILSLPTKPAKIIARRAACDADMYTIDRRVQKPSGTSRVQSSILLDECIKEDAPLPLLTYASLGLPGRMFRQHQLGKVSCSQLCMQHFQQRWRRVSAPPPCNTMQHSRITRATANGIEQHTTAIPCGKMRLAAVP